MSEEELTLLPTSNLVQSTPFYGCLQFHPSHSEAVVNVLPACGVLLLPGPTAHPESTPPPASINDRMRIFPGAIIVY